MQIFDCTEGLAPQPHVVQGATLLSTAHIGPPLDSSVSGGDGEQVGEGCWKRAGRKGRKEAERERGEKYRK